MREHPIRGARSVYEYSRARAHGRVEHWPREILAGDLLEEGSKRVDTGVENPRISGS